LDDWKGGDYDEAEVKEAQESGNYPYSYSGACAVTLGEKGAGTIGLGCGGVVSSTGFGDGGYPVFAKYEDGRVKELKIVFF